MAININNNLLNPAGARSSESRDRQGDAIGTDSKEGQNSVAKPVTARTDSVNLSSEGKNLRQIEDKLSSQPEIDQDKVARIKKAIAEGSYQVDARKLADNLFAMEAQLNKL
ncbi:flagellar biosynthesis anti-sigma factor FlgM [Aestuariirhabdus litorea]|uniref:Negative regulator of flagellin synthesis n=1 Tax=Aestuariirhabdus litorea TaxID=2528527 RepID=A0A3P3VRT2_9GAMM|nr:flagellar biosynthesis anti-sigma factor FlgM [Aestuariirhabdus litorea]RRJ85017.1 flagellar biosynthesis anti-sigma factor FlgM [Aestuariirhabdus litorea]RWW98242.1 flagellar biosynthesis anti-sigma factor FlgM [Endozoicomonadaceae bacterium GTF-13]